MIDLPESVQSSILSKWCDGPSLLHYFEVLLSSNSHLHNIAAFDLIRDALVDRFKTLANNHEYYQEDYEEVRDVLDVVREEIRTCKVIQQQQQQQQEGSQTMMAIVGGEFGETTTIAKKVSDWCAIVTYFDTMKRKINGGFVLWCGELKSHQGFGTLAKAQITSSLWTVTSLDYFYNQLELCNEYLTHPALNLDDELDPLFLPYGYLSIAEDNRGDYEVLQRIKYSLRRGNGFVDGTTISPRFFLVPSQMEYETTTLGFAWDGSILENDDEKNCLLLYLDGEDEGDFEYSLSRLAENVKRILQRMRQMQKREKIHERFR